MVASCAWQRHVVCLCAGAATALLWLQLPVSQSFAPPSKPHRITSSLSLPLQSDTAALPCHIELLPPFPVYRPGMENATATTVNPVGVILGGPPNAQPQQALCCQRPLQDCG